MYFLDDLMKELCNCPECGSKLLLMGIEPGVSDGCKDIELEAHTLCSNDTCNINWKFKLNLEMSRVE